MRGTMRGTKEKLIRYAGIMGLVVLFGCAGPQETMAASHSFIQHEWVDENKGPGVAKWVDESGKEAEPSHMEHVREQQEETLVAGETGGPHTSITQESAEVVSPAPQETQSQQKVQPEQTPVPEQHSGRTIDPNKPMIALTFDDGPYASVGNQIMDCLAKYGGKATFFVVGNRCANYKTEMRRMAAEGHEIGNHTYDHKYLNKLNAEQIRYQISKGNEAIESTAGVKCKLVRLPGGNKNDTVLANVDAPMIMWNIDTEDWKTKNAQKTINAVVGKVRDGDIVLMHEIYKQSGAAAVEIIPALVNQGYQLVTVSELAQHRGGMQNGKMYYRFRP